MNRFKKKKRRTIRCRSTLHFCYHGTAARAQRFHAIDGYRCVNRSLCFVGVGGRVSKCPQKRMKRKERERERRGRKKRQINRKVSGGKRKGSEGEGKDTFQRRFALNCLSAWSVFSSGSLGALPVIHGCSRICSHDQRSLGSSQSMWRIKSFASCWWGEWWRESESV